MVIRKSLLRQGRQLHASFSFFACQRRGHLTTANLQWNLPAEAQGKSTTQLYEEGYINENVAKWLLKKQREERTGTYGARLLPTYQPHNLISNPPDINKVTLEILLASQAHLGHNTSLWNPANAQYIFGIRDGIHIISLDVTAAHLRRAARVLELVVRRGGLVLFVGTREGHQRAVTKAAQLSGGYHLFDKWVRGTLTNGLIVLNGCGLKVVDQLDRKLEGFEEQLEEVGCAKPDLVVVMNPVENRNILHECSLCNIPTIGIIDTNASPHWVTYPIPANDDSLRCVHLICGVLGRAGEKGRKERLEAAREGEIAFNVNHSLKMPQDFYEALDKDDADRQVIDLRDKATVGKVRFAQDQKQ